MSADSIILLTGTSGQVGGDLLPLLAPFGRVVAPGRGELDLSQPDQVREYVRRLRPRWIVNPAAYTAVDKAESEPELAYAINRDAVASLGEAAQEIGAVVVHFSTDYVFEGEGTQPFVETDATGPQGVYGASKLAGEQALAASGAAHLIFRTSWVYGATGKNFLRTILKLARQKESLRIVADQYGAPTWARDLARMTVAIVKQLEAKAAEEAISISEAARAVTGIYHACGGGETTWHGFASEAIRQMQEREPQTRFATLEPIPTSEYPTPARRPLNSRMNCEKLARTFGWTMPAWQDSLTAVLAEL